MTVRETGYVDFLMEQKSVFNFILHVHGNLQKFPKRGNFSFALWRCLSDDVKLYYCYSWTMLDVKMKY